MVSFENVFVVYENETILDNVNLKIDRSDFISLIGETGVGKTTLLKLIYFDLLPTKGVVTVGRFRSDSIKKRDIPQLRRLLGIVFQDFRLLDDRNVFDNVAFALEVTGAKRNEISKRVLRVLSDVGLSHKKNSMIDELSGGEQQRVVIARALVNNPILLMADEPTGNLDFNTSMELLQLLKRINASGTAVILATHNYDLVRKSGSRIVQIKDAKVGEIDPNSF